METWFGLAGPPNMPKEIVARLHAAIVKAVDNAQAKEALGKVGLDPVTSTPEEFAAFIRQERDKWGPVVKASGAKME